jgi:hypothetical protein
MAIRDAIHESEIPPNLTAKIAKDLKISKGEARTLIKAAEPLWDALAKLGFVDGYLGAEVCRVLPEALVFIHRESNLGPR